MVISLKSSMVGEVWKCSSLELPGVLAGPSGWNCI